MLLCGEPFSPQHVERMNARIHALLYRRDRISSGKAAFIQMLAEEGIPYIDYTPAEVDDELATLKPWRHESRQDGHTAGRYV